MRTIQRIAWLAPSAALVFAVPTSAGGAEPQPMTLVDLIEVPQVADPQLSPDAKQVLYVLSQVDWKVNKRVEHLFRVNADGSGLCPDDERDARRIQPPLVP